MRAVFDARQRDIGGVIPADPTRRGPVHSLIDTCPSHGPSESLCPILASASDPPDSYAELTGVELVDICSASGAYAGLTTSRFAGILSRSRLIPHITNELYSARAVYSPLRSNAAIAKSREARVMLHESRTRPRIGIPQAAVGPQAPAVLHLLFLVFRARFWSRTRGYPCRLKLAPPYFSSYSSSGAGDTSSWLFPLHESPPFAHTPSMS